MLKHLSIMARCLVLLYFALCSSCVLFSTATGTTTLSADRAHSCPGSGAEVKFTCVVNTTVLSWDIDFLGHHDDIDRVHFDTNDFIGRQLNVHTNQGTEYTFNLTSKSPLTSTMTTNAFTDISGAIISCRDGHSSSAHVDTLVVEIMSDPQKVSNVTVVIPNIPISYSAAADIVNVTLEWDMYNESYPTNLERTNLQISSYIVIVYPDTLNSESIFHTADTSILLVLNYDQDYNISVVASNCVGNSTPAEIRIRLVHCGSSVGKDIDVSSSTRGNRQSNKLKTYCLYSSQSGLVPVFTPGETGLDKSTLIDDCSKNGSTHQYSSSVSEILVPALTASHFLLSSCTLIIGLLVGSLSHRCCRKKTNMSSMNEKVAEEPVYSEIPPKSVPSANHVSELVKSVDNVAYGQVSPP